MGRVSKDINGRHIDLARGNPVQATSEIKIINGQIKYIDNSSGHYLPLGLPAQRAVEDAFSNLGFNTVNKYVEKRWIEDITLKNGGKWRPQS